MCILDEKQKHFRYWTKMRIKHIRLKRIALYFCVYALLQGCTGTGSNQRRSDEYRLEPTKEYLTFVLDEYTHMPLKKIDLASIDGKDYLYFINGQKPEILVYDMENTLLSCKMSFEAEGPHGVGKEITNAYLKSFDEVYVSNGYTKTIYRSNSACQVVSKYDFTKAEDGLVLTTILGSMGCFELIDGKFYIPQSLNKALGSDLVNESSVCAIMDTTQKRTFVSDFKYPPLIQYSDLGTPAGFGFQYRRIFDGTNFIYSFLYSDSLYKVSKDHKKREAYQIKSKYISSISIPGNNSSDLKEVLKATCEEATYEDLVYDKYRNVYYRFACPGTEVDTSNNLSEIIRFGKSQFSIIILDANLSIIGETLFPEYTYVPTAHFVNEEGLYISCSHFMSSDYSDDELCFEKIELKY